MHLLHALRKWMFLYIIFHLGIKESEAGSRKRINFVPTYLTTDEVIAYLKTFFSRTSSQDKTNEIIYQAEEYAEDLYTKIENLVPLHQYIEWLMKTKEITDKAIGQKSLLSKYANQLNAGCSRYSVFNHTLAQVLQVWDGDRTIVTNDLDEWHKLNQLAPPNAICNRFRGLTCTNLISPEPEKDNGLVRETSENTTCQCAGESSDVGYFSPMPNTAGNAYPEGCYIRPWRPCGHLSAVSGPHDADYNMWHTNLQNDRALLAQTMFPIARTARCKQGTYCMNLVPGWKHPICWCTQKSEDPTCKNPPPHHNYTAPALGAELMNLRSRFEKLIIPAADQTTPCNPELNKDVELVEHGAGYDPTKTGTVEAMKKLTTVVRGLTAHICDFREALYCDAKTKKCSGKLNCGAGKVHLGQGICVSDNGYQCQSNEDCVQNARCTFFQEIQDSACVCETGYGGECLLQNRPFFGRMFLPMISGYKDEDFISLQVEIYKSLESWEDSMRLTAGEQCDAADDPPSMNIVNYFGSLYAYDKERGTNLLSSARRIARDSSWKLCRYNKFQHCDDLLNRCVPFRGSRILSSTKNSVGDPKIVVECNEWTECSPPIPKIFEEIVTFVCKPGYICDFYKGTKKFCILDCTATGASRPKNCPEEEAEASDAMEPEAPDPPEPPSPPGGSTKKPGEGDSSSDGTDIGEPTPPGPHHTTKHPHASTSHPHESTSHPHESTSHPHKSTSHPHASTSHPHASTSHPHASTSHPHASTSHPHASTSHPHASTSHPHASTSHPHASTSHPHASTSHPHASTSHPHASTSHPHASTSHPHASTSHPHASTSHPHPPDHSSTPRDHSATPPDHSATPPDHSATPPHHGSTTHGDGVSPHPPTHPTPPPPPPEQPSPPDFTTETIETSNLGKPCKSDDDCDIQTFWTCVLAQEKCACMGDLIVSGNNCKVPLDGPCKDQGLAQLKSLGYEVSTSPDCVSGGCEEINGANFCKSTTEVGSMFITKQKLSELDDMEGSGGSVESESASASSVSASSSLVLVAGWIFIYRQHLLYG